jgi:hypothetical protein
VGLAAASLEGRRTGSYERHRPETTTLYAVVRDDVETLYAAVAAGFEGAALPPIVRRELEGYLDCGLITRTLAHKSGRTRAKAGRAPARRWQLPASHEARATAKLANSSAPAR